MLIVHKNAWAGADCSFLVSIDFLAVGTPR